MSNLLDWIKSLDRDKEKKGFQILKPETRQKVDTYTKNKLIRDQQKFQRIDNRRENAKKMLTKDFWQRGFQNIRDAGDPGQYLITRAAANIPQDTKTALSPIVGRPIANDIGYGLRGATQLTPLAWANQLSPNSKSGQMWQQSAPKTEHNKKMQRIGRNAYGMLLTAPLGGGSALQNIGSRAVQGGTLAGGINTIKNVATGEKWNKDLGKSIAGGVENSWQLAFTNLATDKLAAKFFPKLTSDALQKGGNLLKETLSSSGKEAAKQVFKQNAVNLFKRALLESPIENTWFTAINNLTGEDKRKFAEAWMEDIWGTIGGNLAYAGLATGKQKLWDLNKNEINAAGEALVNTYKKMFAGGKEGQGGYIKIGPDQKVNIDSKIEENFKRIFKEDSPENKQLLQDFKDSYEKALKQSVNYEQFQKNLTADLYSKNRGWKMDTLDVMVRRILPKNMKDSIDFKSPAIKIKGEVTDPLAQEYEQSMDSLTQKPGEKTGENELVEELIRRQNIKIANGEALGKPVPPAQSTSASVKQFNDYISIGDNQAAIKHLDQATPSKQNVFSSEVSTAYKRGVEGTDAIVNNILKKIDGKVSEAEFIDLAKAKAVTGDPIVDEAIADYKALTDFLYKNLEDTNVGKITKVGYVPEVDPNRVSVSEKDFDELFPGAIIRRSNIEEPNLKTRKGVLKEKSTDLKKITHDLAEQTFYHKYRDITAPISETKQVIVDELNSVNHLLKQMRDNPTDEKLIKKNLDILRSKKPLNYVELMKNESSLPKSEVDYKVDLKLGDNTIRRDTNVFERMGDTKGGEELQNAFKFIKDADELYVHRQIKTDQILSGESPETELIKYWAKELELTGKELHNFNTKSKDIIISSGAKSFNDKMLSHVYNSFPIDNFVDTLSKVDIKELSTQEYINNFIHRVIIKNKIKQTGAAQVLDAIGMVFSTAHIGGNIKVAAMQPLEATKLPFLYGTDNTVKGVKKSITDSERIFREYGYGKQKSTYNLENMRTQEGVEGSKLRKALFAGLEATENWKNRMFVGAIEEKFLKDGVNGSKVELGSKELRDAVREEVSKYALPGGKFEAPVAMKESAVLRSLGQYSNFAIGGTVKKVDAISDKEYAKLAGLVASDLTNIAIVAAVTGMPLNWLIEGMFPIGVAPVISVPINVFKEVNKIVKGDNDEDKKAARKLFELAIQNFMPAGAQMVKSGNTTETLVRGYNQSPSGMVQYQAPDLKTFNGMVSAGLGLMFGEGALFENREYYKDEKPIGLGKVDSQIYKTITDRDKQREFYDTTVGWSKRKSEINKENEKKKGGGLFKIKASEDTIDTSTPLLKTEAKTRISEKIKYGEPVTPEELKLYYLDDYNSMPSKTKYEQNERVEEAYEVGQKIIDNEFLSQEDKNAIYKDLETSEEELSYFKVAKDTAGDKELYVEEQLETMGDDEKLEFLLTGRTVVNDKLLVSDTFINKLVKSGEITSSQGDALKSVIFVKDNSYEGEDAIKMGDNIYKPEKQTSGGSGSGFGTGNIKKVNMPIGVKRSAPKSIKITTGSSGKPYTIKVTKPNLSKRKNWRSIRLKY